MLDMLEKTAYDLWRATLICSSTPTGEQLFERMSHPQIGDMVLETTTIHRIKKNRRGFGKLVAIERSEVFYGVKYTVQTPDGNLCDWTNAHFIAIPCGTFDFYPTLMRPQNATG